MQVTIARWPFNYCPILVVLTVNLAQPRITWEKEISIRELPGFNWFVCCGDLF